MGQNKHIFLRIIMSTMFIIFLGGNISVLGKESALLVLEPDTLFLKPGEQGQFSVWVKGVDDLYGAEFKLRFDPSIFEVLDNDPNQEGVQVTLSDVFRDGFVAVNQVDNQNGTITFAATRMNPAPPFQGDGEVIKITVSAKAVGETTLVFDQPILANRDGMPIEFEAKKASFLVNENIPKEAPDLQESQTDQSQIQERRGDEERVQPILLIAAVVGVFLLIGSSIAVIRVSTRRKEN